MSTRTRFTTAAAATTAAVIGSTALAIPAAAVTKIDLNDTYNYMLRPGQRVVLLNAPAGKLLIEGPKAVKVKVKKNGKVVVTGKKTKRSCYADKDTIVRWVDPETGRGGAGAWIELRVCDGESGIPN